jgi:hypothetical protein
MSEKISTNVRSSQTKSTFRRETGVTANIQSSPKRIWALLTNAADFPRWNSTVKSIDGNIVQGEKIKLVANAAPERVFNLAISEFTPEKRMVWRDGAAPMFTGIRTYTLTPQADGSTDFEMVEVFSGIMMPMIAGSLPDFEPSFKQYATDLKREAERSS